MILTTREYFKNSVDYLLDMVKKGEIVKIVDDDEELILSKVEG